jgi:hypothetical protein
MSTYFLLIISFMLAVFGTFYKSVKTDEKGNILYSRPGIPALTQVGKMIVALLTLSFAVSLYVTWDNGREAKQKEERLSEQNALLQRQISRALDPIKDIQLAFDIRVPLVGREMEAYRKRLEEEFKPFHQEELISGPLSKESLPNPHPLKDLSEVKAHLYFDRTKIDIEIFKAPAEKSTRPDLEFSIRCRLDQPSSLAEEQECAGKMGLWYERARNEDISIRLQSSPVKAESTIWNSNGRIAAVSDLAGATIVVRFNPPGLGVRLQQIQPSVEILEIDLKVSGRTFTFQGKELIRRQDKNGMIVYISTFPGTISATL